MTLKALLDQIDTHDTAYYNEGKPTISDPEYDGLKDRLGALVKAFTKAADPATEALQARAARTLARIGATPPIDGSWQKVEHMVPMQSLNKCNTPEELAVWIKKCK
jgi:DNA ligase (NAD+)